MEVLLCGALTNPMFGTKKLHAKQKSQHSQLNKLTVAIYHLSACWDDICEECWWVGKSKSSKMAHLFLEVFISLSGKRIAAKMIPQERMAPVCRAIMLLASLVFLCMPLCVHAYRLTMMLVTYVCGFLYICVCVYIYIYIHIYACTSCCYVYMHVGTDDHHGHIPVSVCC